MKRCFASSGTSNEQTNFGILIYHVRVGYVYLQFIIFNRNYILITVSIPYTYMQVHQKQQNSGIVKTQEQLSLR